MKQQPFHQHTKKVQMHLLQQMSKDSFLTQWINAFHQQTIGVEEDAVVGAIAQDEDAVETNKGDNVKQHKEWTVEYLSPIVGRME